MQRFEFKDAKSNKFWEVDVQGKTLHVNFGRIGTEGQSKSKAFGTPEKATAEMEKLIREKVGKGYVEIGAGMKKSSSVAKQDALASLSGKLKQRKTIMAGKTTKAPAEWQSGKIQMKAPPAAPIRGRGNQRLEPEDFGFEISDSLFKWFFKCLDPRHKYSGPKIHDPDDIGDQGPGFINNFKAISPEGAKLLKTYRKFFEERHLEDKASQRAKKNQDLQMEEQIAPSEWVAGRIKLESPAVKVREKYYWKPDFEGENYKAVLWYRDHLPNSHRGQVTDPNNGFPAKTMSVEAGKLWFKHRNFWVQEFLKPARELIAKKQKSALEAKESLNKASGKAGITPAEMKKKLERFAEMAQGSQLNLAITMIEGSEDAWFFEAILAGSSISKGFLLPGKVLKKAGKAGELLGLIALINTPQSAELPKTLNKNLVEKWKIKVDYLEFFAVHVFSKATWISSFDDSKEGWYISLEGLKNLSDAAAEALSRHKGTLRLNGLKNLSDAAAEALSRHKGDLNLNGLKSLSDAAAEALSRHKGYLGLDGLTSLSDADAKALSKHEGKLGLAGLGKIKHLSAEFAEVLVKDPDSLNLSNLKNLSDAAAEALSRHKGTLHLNGLKNLSDAAAEALSRHKGDLNLDGLTSLSDSPGHVALAEKFSRNKWYLGLDGLTSLSDAAAEALSRYKGDLNLDRLTSLSDAAAEALSRHKGYLGMDGLTSLSDAAAEALSRHKGYLGMGGLTSLSDAAAEALSRHKGDLNLNRLTSLSDSPGHVALAEKFSRHKGYLNLNGLTSLSDSPGHVALAEKLSRRKGNLFLRGLTSLSDAAAEALSRHEWDLYLDGLTSLSDAAAKALARKKGGMRALSVTEKIEKQIQKYRKK